MNKTDVCWLTGDIPEVCKVKRKPSTPSPWTDEKIQFQIPKRLLSITTYNWKKPVSIMDETKMKILVPMERLIMPISFIHLIKWIQVHCNPTMLWCMDRHFCDLFENYYGTVTRKLPACNIECSIDIFLKYSYAFFQGIQKKSFISVTLKCFKFYQF